MHGLTQVVNASVSSDVGHLDDLSEVIVIERFSVGLQGRPQVVRVQQTSTALVEEPQSVF